MTDIFTPTKKRENPDVANKPVGAVKLAKLASPASVLDIPGPVEDGTVPDDISTASTLPCAYGEDRYACVPENHLPVPDRTWLYNHLRPRHIQEMSENDKMSLYYTWRRLVFIESTKNAGAVLTAVHLYSMDFPMLKLLFLEWTDLQMHKNLQGADEIREAEELEYHQRVAYDMEYVDHDDYNTPPSSSDSFD
jgi:hypothetical protein